MFALIHEKNLLTCLPGLGMCLILLASCSGGDTPVTSTTSTTTPPASAGTTVQVSVNATDPDNDQLHYRWAVTEGTINNVDAPKTTWTVPPGSGLQFAYVVVSDNKGGYIESRAAVMTYGQPTAATTAAPTITPASSIGTSRGFVWGSIFYKPASFGRNVYLPGVTIQLYSGTIPVGQPATTDLKGQFFISNVPDGTYSAKYEIPGRPAVPLTFPPDTATNLEIVVDATNNNFPTSPSSPRYVRGQIDLAGTLNVAGSVRLADRSYCGIRDEFLTDLDPQNPNMLKGPVSATAQLLTANNGPLSPQFPVNHYGDYLIVRSALSNATQVKVRIHCEQSNEKDSASFLVQSSGTYKDLGGVLTLDNSRPVIGSMTVLLNGQDVGRPDLPKPRTVFTSVDGTSARFGDPDLIAEIIDIPGDDTFFTYKGIDTRKSACAYYRAIGAVAGCDVNGFPTGAQLTLDEWRSKFNLSPFPTGNPTKPPAADGQEIRIQYINRSDLNLGRDMQAIKLNNGDIAYNTCNYPGPQDVNSPVGAPAEIGPQTEPDIQANIDLAINNIRRGIGMIACVAMDYSAIPGINGGQPFTKFYTFGPTGKLLLSLSLDGRREKFMPGTCTTCHGGKAYGGQFPDDGSGRPDLQSHWQPFDMANLKVRFSSAQDLAAANAAVKELNQRMNVVALTTPRTRELISNWYLNDRPDQNPDFIPSQSPTQDKDLYQKVIQPGCQTCHAAQGSSSQSINENITDTTKICGGSPVLEQNHKMTNSLVPFERFWLDSTLSQLLRDKGGATCSNTPNKHPAL